MTLADLMLYTIGHAEEALLGSEVRIQIILYTPDGQRVMYECPLQSIRQEASGSEVTTAPPPIYLLAQSPLPSSPKEDTP